MYYCLWCNAGYEKIPDNGICPKCHHNQFKEMKMTWVTVPGQKFILKLSSRDVLESMRAGNIWFNSPKYYQEFKGNPAICDIHECAFDYLEYKDGKPIGKISSTQNWHRLLCFYQLHTKEDGEIVIPNEKIKSFGDCFAAIDIPKFKKRIMNWCNVRDYDCFADGVKYHTTNYEGDYNPTFKDTSYSYQNEARFIITSEKISKFPEKEPLKVKFNGLEDTITTPAPIDLLFEKQTIEELWNKCGWNI